MDISITGLNEFGLVKLLNSFPFPVVALSIESGPRYLVATKLKKIIKETKQARDYPRIEFSTVDFAALDRAFMYYGYELC